MQSIYVYGFAKAMEPKAISKVYYYFIKIFSFVRGIIEDFSLLCSALSHRTFELNAANTHGMSQMLEEFLSLSFLAVLAEQNRSPFLFTLEVCVEWMAISYVGPTPPVLFIRKMAINLFFI